MKLPAREYDRGINSEIERLLYQNDVVMMDARGLAAQLDEKLFNWAPGDKRWTIGQCMHHLNITHEKSLPHFEQAVHSARENGITGDGPYTYGFMARIFLRYLEPPVKLLKASAPPGFRPRRQLDRDKVMAEFRDHHERLKKILHEANGLNLSNIKVKSAFSNAIKYQMGMGFWITLAHDRRHIWQARQVCLEERFPK